MNRYFSPVPDITQPDLTAWERAMFDAVKQNLEMLAGGRGNEHTAVLRGDIATDYPSDVQSTGAYVTISGNNVPTLEEHLLLRNDVLILRQVVADLLSRLKT